jgi:hypothetical protein
VGNLQDDMFGQASCFEVGLSFFGFLDKKRMSFIVADICTNYGSRLFGGLFLNLFFL